MGWEEAHFLLLGTRPRGRDEGAASHQKIVIIRNLGVPHDVSIGFGAGATAGGWLLLLRHVDGRCPKAVYLALLVLQMSRVIATCNDVVDAVPRFLVCRLEREVQGHVEEGVLVDSKGAENHSR